jgi:small-conductance mechanosensitive channel
MSGEGKGSGQGRPRWLVPALVATSLLIVLAVGAYLVFGRELFQRPVLAIAVVAAWLGALVGIGIGSETGRL